MKPSIMSLHLTRWALLIKLHFESEGGKVWSQKARPHNTLLARRRSGQWSQAEELLCN